MPQPVKLSDPLIDAARAAAPLAHRSLAAQVEHWAALGRAVDATLTAEQAAQVKRSLHASVAEPPRDASAVLIDALVHAVSPAFADQVRASLATRKGPVYGTHAAFPGYLVRYERDGSLTPGRLVNREFIPTEDVQVAASVARSEDR